MPAEIIPAAFDWFDAIQKGGAVSAVLTVGALGWVIRDRARILVAYAADMKAKDDLIADKDAKLLDVSVRYGSLAALLLERMPARGGPST